jgi:hypothetical protein
MVDAVSYTTSSDCEDSDVFSPTKSVASTLSHDGQRNPFKARSAHSSQMNGRPQSAITVTRPFPPSAKESRIGA